MDDDDLDAMLDDAADDVLASAPPPSSSASASRASAPSPTDVLDDAASAVFQQHQPLAPSHGMLRVPRPLTSAPPKHKGPPTLEEALAAVLPPAQAEKWRGVLKTDAIALQSCRPRPPSFAYQSFHPSSGVSGGGGGSKSKRGSDTATAAAAAAAAAAEEEDQQGAGPWSVLPELILRACSSAGVRNTEGLRTELKTNAEMRGRLEVLFVKQMTKDLRPLVEEDERFERERFPATARQILGLMDVEET